MKARLAQYYAAVRVTAAIIGLGHDFGQIRKRGLGWSPNLGAGGGALCEKLGLARALCERANNSGPRALHICSCSGAAGPWGSCYSGGVATPYLKGCCRWFSAHLHLRYLFQVIDRPFTPAIDSGAICIANGARSSGRLLFSSSTAKHAGQINFTQQQSRKFYLI